jgi:predicted AlkP superfamily pyrophosphatase or phosphodiesterase
LKYFWGTRTQGKRESIPVSNPFQIEGLRSRPTERGGAVGCGVLEGGRRALGLATLASLIWTAEPAPAAGAEAAAEPGLRLVVVIAVDQLGRDRLDRDLPGGLGRIAREGRVYSEAALDHAVTNTCPGHVTLATGRWPAAAGVAGNNFVDRATGKVTYCVADPNSPVLGEQTDDPARGRSPRSIRVTALGDWMRAADPQSRVFAVGGKDRAAISLAGQRPTGAYWFSPHERVGFTTSRWYASELPAWLETWNAAFLGGLPELWEHETERGDDPRRPDDFIEENPEFGRTSPHPLWGADPRESASALRHSPYLDQLTLELARELIGREQLGQDDAADLLAIALSSTDLVGHRYGPESHEARDALHRLDGWLATFLDELDASVGRDRYVVALSSDHGVLPLPGWLGETGREECPIEGGRIFAGTFMLGQYWSLYWRFSALRWPEGWFEIGGGGVNVNRGLAERLGVEPADVVAALEVDLEALPGVREAWTHEEVRSREGELAELYRHSLVPDRSADLLVQVEPSCLLTLSEEGTDHGTPYAYDRDVPLVFFGAGIAPAQVSGAVRTVDMAPTLAALLGIEPPDELDGRALSTRP